MCSSKQAMQQCRGKAFSLRNRATGCQFQVEKELRLMPKICKSNVSSSQCIRASMVSKFEPVQQVPLRCRLCCRIVEAVLRAATQAPGCVATRARRAGAARSEALRIEG